MRAVCTLAAVALVAMTSPSRAETVQLYAAGSLRAALTEVARAFESESGQTVQGKYGPSGLLKDEIAAGAKADVFASANMDCTAARESQKQTPELQIVELPDNLAVGADYGLTVITGASSAAERFAKFTMSAAGQKILASHGFAPGQTER
jgi:ABC-type molybdate transport system substrate-binding protein